MTPSLRVLVLGSGGREHALTRALIRDPAVRELHCAPGNPGTAKLATNHPVDVDDPAAVTRLATSLGVNLVVIGPEAPLVAGVADAVRDAGIACFGPGRAAAQLEGSKAFAKRVMAAAGVPTAAARVCTNAGELAAALDEFGPPHVVKADGLAAGKGVLVTTDRDAALAHGLQCLGEPGSPRPSAAPGTGRATQQGIVQAGRPVVAGSGQHGGPASGLPKDADFTSRVVVEEYLDGPELSLFVLTDGHAVRPMLPAQDFKRLEDADTGPNTGGMGAYAPLPWLPAATVPTVMRRVVTPTLDHLRGLGTPFTGLLYVGLALTARGPRVVEFNARFGDPETEVLLPLLEQPLGQLLYAAATGTLADQPELSFADEACVGVVMAASGYPGHPRHGARIGLPPDTDTVHVIHAGTAEQDGRLVAAGGRALVVVGRGADLAQARQRVYQHIGQIRFTDGVYRHDIAAPERLAAHATATARWLPGEDA